MTFDGDTYDPAQDFERLTTLLERVRYAVTHPHGEWWTLAHLRERCGGSEASVSARLRDLRKDKFGGHEIERRRVNGGLWEYRAVLKIPVRGQVEMF